MLLAPPTQGDQVPSNARALAYQFGEPQSQFGWKLDLIEVIDPSAKPVAYVLKPDTIETIPYRYQLLELASPLAEGVGYKIRWKASCQSYKAYAADGEVAFNVGPAAVSPSSIGSITLKPDNAVEVSLSAEAQAWLPLATFVISNESNFSTAWTTYGMYAGDTFERSYQLWCSEAGPWTSSMVLHMHVAGAETDPPPLTWTVDHECAPWSVDGGPMYDAPAMNEGGDGVAQPAGNADDGGCSCASKRSAKGIGCLELTVVAILAIAARRRRRIRQAHDQGLTPITR
jgi:hypothetical protein